MADEFDISGLKSSLGFSSAPSNRNQMAMDILQDEYSKAKKRLAAGDVRAQGDIDSLTREITSKGGKIQSLPDSMLAGDGFDISGLSGALKLSPSEQKTAQVAAAKPMFEPKNAFERKAQEFINAIPGAQQLGAFGQGVGGAISESMGALQQLAGQFSDKQKQEALKNIQQTQQALAPIEQQYPTAAMAGKLTGYVVNPMNKLIPGFGGPAQTMLGAAAKGAAQGAIANTLTTPVTDENQPFLTEKLKQAAVGGLGGSIVGTAANAFSRIAQPFENNLSKVSKENVEILRNAGIPVDVAQATGSQFLNRVKAGLNDNPFTAGKEHEFAATQQAAFNKAIAKTMGEDASAITPNVLSAAKARLGETYDNLFNQYGSKISGSIYKDLAGIRDEAKRVLPESEYGPIKNIVDDIINKASQNRSTLSGDQYQAIKRALDRMSQSNNTSAGYAREMKDVLLEGLTKSAEAAGKLDDIALLKATNKQYGNMKKIEDVVLKDGQGNVSPSLLANSLATKGKRNAIYAEDAELAKLARAGKDILQSKVPNSGTVARLSAQAAPAVVGGALYGLYEGDVSGALKGAAAGYAAPKAAQMLLRNPSSAQYLEKGMTPGMARSAIEGAQTLGQILPSYTPTGAAGGISLRELINLRNQQAQ